MKCLLLLLFVLIGINVVCCTKRRHRENTTSTIVEGTVLEGEIIGTIEYDDLENEVKTEADFNRLSMYYYNDFGQVIYKGKVNEQDDLSLIGCDPKEKLTVLVHGWTQTCDKEVMKILAQKFKQYRGGCVACFDYGPYAADPNYFRLVRHFRMLRDALADKLNIFASQGFQFENSHAWGFSYGARLILRACERTNGRYRSIDICDMAGPGFDNKVFKKCDYRGSAENVQCIYTSRNRGTRCTTGCHQNWLMGHCGEYQDAAAGLRSKSHVMCPLFYISSFENPFYAVKTNECTLSTPAQFPEFYKMGYMENDKSVRGQLTAMTSKSAPYNIPLISINAQHNTKLTPIPENDTLIELTEEEEWYGVALTEEETSNYSFSEETEDTIETTTFHT